MASFCDKSLLGTEIKAQILHQREDLIVVSYMNKKNKAKLHQHLKSLFFCSLKRFFLCYLLYLSLESRNSLTQTHQPFHPVIIFYRH